MERIIGAALKTSHGVYYRGLFHADCYYLKSQAHDKDNCMEGFITSSNHFITPAEAAQVAYAAGQITTPIEKLDAAQLWGEISNR